MAITQIQDPYAQPGVSPYGEQIGQVLGSGIEQLAQQKMAQIQKNNLAKQFQQMGIPGQIAFLPPNLQQEIVKNLAQEGQIGLGGQPSFGAPSLGQIPGQERFPGQQAFTSQGVFPNFGGLNRKERFAAERAERPYYQDVLNAYKTSHTTNKDLDRMIELINKGGVVNPTIDHLQRWLSSTLKINLKDLRGADTEEYEKIVAGFMKNAKQIFGSRITNFDLEQFLKTLPTLSVSHEGKMRLIGSMKAAAKAQELEYEALRHLMRMNGGRIPPYAQMMVEEMLAPELDRLSQEFISGQYAPQLSQEGKVSANKYDWLRAIKGLGTLAGTAGSTVAGNLAGSKIGGAIGKRLGSELSGKVLGGLAGGKLGFHGRGIDED